MVFGLNGRRLENILESSRQLLNQSRQNRNLVAVPLLGNFNGVALSSSLAILFALFYTRSLYESFEYPIPQDKLVRLTPSSLKDLLHSRDLIKASAERCIISPGPTMALHSDASN